MTTTTTKRATRTYSPQMDRKFQDDYYDREDAAILRIQEMGATGLEDHYFGRRVMFHGQQVSGDSWQDIAHRIAALRESNS